MNNRFSLLGSLLPSLLPSRRNYSTSQIMQLVMVALCPGLLVMVFYFGFGILINVAFSVLFALLFELMILKFREKDVRAVLGDGSAVVTGILIGLALPPMLPVWMIVIANFFAIVVAKHLYGGLGQNLFNPAMVGFAVLIVSFPVAMSLWPSTIIQVEKEQADYSSFEVLLQTKIGGTAPDAISSATPLDRFRQKGAMTVNELWQAGEFGLVSGKAWEMINLAFFLSGLALIAFRLASWRAPLSMLLSLGLMALFFYDGGSSASMGSPFFHWFSGATMLCAFFIVTDPVTSPDSETAQFIFGAGAGLLIFLVRSIGGFPEGAAFAVLLMNALSPALDQLTIRMKK